MRSCVRSPTAPFSCLEFVRPNTISSASPSSLPCKISSRTLGGRIKVPVLPLPLIPSFDFTAIHANPPISLSPPPSPPPPPPPPPSFPFQLLHPLPHPPPKRGNDFFFLTHARRDL